MPIKKSYIEIKKFMESINYKLLSTEYINSKKKLQCICNNGHSINITYDSIRSGRRCYICANNQKFSIDFIRSEFKKSKYILLSTEYINNRQLLDFICDKGHTHKMSYDAFKSNQRCGICASENKKKEKKILFGMVV